MLGAKQRLLVVDSCSRICLQIWSSVNKTQIDTDLQQQQPPWEINLSLRKRLYYFIIKEFFRLWTEERKKEALHSDTDLFLLSWNSAQRKIQFIHLGRYLFKDRVINGLITHYVTSVGNKGENWCNDAACWSIIFVSFDLELNWILPYYYVLGGTAEIWTWCYNAPHHRVKHISLVHICNIIVTERDVADDIIDDDDDDDDEGWRNWSGEDVAVEQRLRQPQALGGGPGPMSWPGGHHTAGDCHDAFFWIYWSHSFGHGVTFILFSNECVSQ